MVTCDSSPLIHLSSIRQLELLERLFQSVQIPEAVWNETVEDGGDRPGAREVQAARAAGWLTVHAVSPSPMLASLLMVLDPGEAETIVLSLQTNPDFAVMDEAAGRAEAESLGLAVIGTLGVLGRAKQVGLVSLVRPLVTQIPHYRIRETLLRHYFEELGE